MRRFLAITSLALVLIALCLQGARWQYDRYELRHAKNELIKANISLGPITEIELAGANLEAVAWRKLEISGTFQPDTEILVRNRYFQEQYGLGVVTLFRSESGRSYWVDRGWVVAGPDAMTPPKVKPVTKERVTLIARVRVEDIERQLGGTVFALPGADGRDRLQTWNQAGSVVTEPVYFDLISASNSEFTPDAPTPLPNLSDGPHLAYSIQWVLFAGFVVFGWFLVLREDRRARQHQLGRKDLTLM